MKYENLIITMVVLYLGAMFAGIMLPMLPLGFGGWAEGLMIALIQALILSVVGIVTGKLGFWNIAVCTGAIFAGGILGGFIAGYISLTGIFATVVVLAIQTIILMWAGLLKGRGK